MSVIQNWLEHYSTDQITLILGLFVGLLFGALAQKSRFCLRAATVEFWRGQVGIKFAIWLFAFATALLLTQVLVYTGNLDTGDIRQLTTVGSLSGAIIGGGIGPRLCQSLVSTISYGQPASPDSRFDRYYRIPS